jgi:hypothetical protein
MGIHTTEIYHPRFNLDGKDNLSTLPTQPAVYGLFAIVDGQPVHARRVGWCRNLQATVRAHFEAEPDGGLATFTQGPWIKLLQYDIHPDTTADETLRAGAESWSRQHTPQCQPDGEYAPAPVELAS